MFVCECLIHMWVHVYVHMCVLNVCICFSVSQNRGPKAGPESMCVWLCVHVGLCICISDI